MDLRKSAEFFDPSKDEARVHIVGCGSVGSTIAELLARCGVSNMTLYDFDTVEPKNVHNQMFRFGDINRPKVEALADLLAEINPDIGEDLTLEPEGWAGKTMSGYIFLCVDSIELRRKIVEQHMKNPYVKAVFDVRTMLTGAQHYAADWSDSTMKENLLASMQFSHDEAAEETPVSACGVTLGIVTTVREICGLAVNNYINFTKGKGIWKFLQFDCFQPLLDCF